MATRLVTMRAVIETGEILNADATYDLLDPRPAQRSLACSLEPVADTTTQPPAEPHRRSVETDD